MPSRCTHGWDLLRQVHLLRQHHLALFERTLHIHILQLVTEIDGLLDQRDETPFDFQGDGGSLLDPLEQSAASLDRESLTTTNNDGSVEILCAIDEGVTVQTYG